MCVCSPLFSAAAAVVVADVAVGVAGDDGDDVSVLVYGAGPSGGASVTVLLLLVCVVACVWVLWVFARVQPVRGVSLDPARRDTNRPHCGSGV